MFRFFPSVEHRLPALPSFTQWYYYIPSMKIPKINVMDKNRQFKAAISLHLLWHRSRRAWQCESHSHHRTLFPFLIWPLITSGSKTGWLKAAGTRWGLWCPILGGCLLADSSECMTWRGSCRAALTEQNKCAGQTWEEFLKQKKQPLLAGDVSEQGLWITSRAGESVSALQLPLSFHTHPISIIPVKHSLEVLNPYLKKKNPQSCSCLLVGTVCPSQYSVGFPKLLFQNPTLLGHYHLLPLFQHYMRKM